MTGIGKSIVDAGAVLALCLILPLAASGQGKSENVIELRSAKELHVRTIQGEEAREFIGNVHFVHPSATEGTMKVWCDRALQYLKQNKIELFGNVRIERDTVTIASQRGTYFGNERHAHFVSDVVLVKGGARLTALSGKYFADQKMAHFLDSVTISDSVSSTQCDALTYFESEERSIAVGNVKVLDTKNATTVYGDSLVHWNREQYSIVPRSPRLVQIDSSAAGILDTLVVVGKTMEAFGDTTDLFRVQDSVYLARGDLAARSRMASFERRNNRIILVGDPIIWYGQSQISGDSIIVNTPGNRLESVEAYGRAMAISRSDTIHAAKFDQLSGREMRLYFEDEQLERIVVLQNATSLYYLVDENKPNGANKSTGDRIEIGFLDGKIDFITVIGGVEGTYVPEQMVIRNESSYNLEGFRWITERPMRQHEKIVMTQNE